VGFATILGCRLPTPQEWRLASRASPTERPNLRDQTWRVQYQWAADRRANGYLPDRGIFVPSNEVPNREVWTESQVVGRTRSAADRAYNDGVLFFHEVAPDGGQSFNHLVGNVGEYVLDGERMYVVGASALSPPAPVRSVEQPHEVANWRDGSNEGYSDVGFRLAFAAPAAPIEQLRVVIEKQPYLVAGNPTTRPIAARE
jgi:formylglycine-generating enzyme required for sulfatase activity